jgi:hypothetical protein
MFNKITLGKFLPQRRQERKEKSFYVSPNLACFAPLRETSVFRFPNREYAEKFKNIFG